MCTGTKSPSDLPMQWKVTLGNDPDTATLGWEVYKEKQEVMPGITKGHFPFDGKEYFNVPKAMHPGGDGEAEGLSDKAYNLWLYTWISKPVEYSVRLGKGFILCMNTTK